MHTSPITIIEPGYTPVLPSEHRRFTVLVSGLFIVLSVVAARSFYLQILRGSEFRVHAEDNRVTSTHIPAPRGIIYDRHNTPLVENVASTDLVLNPTLLPTIENETPLLDNLPRFIGIDPGDIRQALDTARHTQRVVVLARALHHDTVISLEESLDQLPGVQLVSSLVRHYRYAYPASHILGYAGSVSPQELAQRSDIVPTDTVGKDGIEKMYDQKLRGKPGITLQEIDAQRRQRRAVGERAPEAGEDLVLTIDIQLQEFIFNLLAEHDAQKGHDSHAFSGASVIALDPKNGAVRALVSYPSFDPNTFSQPGEQHRAADYLHEERTPLFNRSLQGVYPPGSTIKPLIAAAALQEGIITPQTILLSTGGIRIGQWFFPDWKQGGHGITNLSKALAESVNTFFYILAGGDETWQGLGARTIATYLTHFGLGAPTGLDLPGEKEGFLPSPEWKKQAKGEPWYIGDTYHLGIGQGDLLVTPLQIARATAALANGGMLYTPRLIAHQPPSGRTLPIAAEHLNTVRDGMRAAVTEGSAVRLANLTIALAGKTGTAQIGGSDDTHAWFTSFGPFDRPELVITVVLERGGAGDRDAVPIAQEIWQWWIEHGHSDMSSSDDKV